MVVVFWPLSPDLQRRAHPWARASKLCIGNLNITHHPFHTYIFGPHAIVLVFLPSLAFSCYQMVLYKIADASDEELRANVRATDTGALA